MSSALSSSVIRMLFVSRSPGANAGGWFTVHGVPHTSVRLHVTTTGRTEVATSWTLL